MKKMKVFAALFAFTLCLVGCSKEAASIGIIGGADGPTAIFFTANINWQSICVWIGVTVAVVLVAIILYRNQKKKS